jgi:hypothetical protein
VYNRIIRQGAALTMALLVVTATSWILPGEAGARNVRNTTRTNINQNVNVNRNVNRNVNVHRDIDVDVDYHDYHPVATAVGVAAVATVTAAAIGSIAYSLPPACSAVVVGGMTYQQCGGTWYQPQYAGTQITYVVVNPPY